MTERATYSLTEVADRLGVSRSTIYARAQRDELPVPVIRIGRRMVVSREQLEAVLSERKAS